MIRAIAAIDDKRGIAANGGIPWNIPEDSRYFREQTERGIVLMGEATYQEFAEPLPNRRNVVASRSLIAVREGFELVDDAAAFLHQTDEDVWVIGGAGLFDSLLPFCNELYLTHVEGTFNCDRFFPAYDEEYVLLRSGDRITKNGYTYRFAVYGQKENR